MIFILSMIAFLAISTGPVYSLKCNEGFNASFAGIPFFHWAERECSDNSECFVQELGAKLFDTKLEVVARYGGCISSRYTPLVTCENLFGAKSELDPSVLFNMIPDLDKKFNDLLNDFRINIVEQFRLLFSRGKGTEEFMKGSMKFLTTLGLNMEKAKPLIKPMAKFFSLSIGPDTYNNNYSHWQEHLKDVNNAGIEVLDALGKLDTKDIEITSNLYGFAGNFDSQDSIDQFRQSKYAPLVENLPGLIKSMIPKSWDPDRWYDTFFQLLGDVRIESPKKSSFNVIATMKSAVEIPEKYNRYVDSLLDTAPELVEQMVNGNYTYAGTWAAELVKSESGLNPVTTRLSTSIFKFISGLYSEKIPADINTLITFAPGLFYSYFPEDSKEIDRIYNALSDGFESFDFTKLESTLQETKMSDFFINLIDKLMMPVARLGPNGPMPDPSKQIRDLIIINFSRTFYNIMTSTYEDQLDTFFSTLDKGFEHFPNHYDIGKIISDLITNLGGTVPKEIKPLLDNVQDLLDVSTSQAQRRNPGEYNDPTEKLIRTAIKITKAYKVAFPESKYPDFVQRYIDIIVWTMKDFPKLDSDSRCQEVNYSSPTWAEDMNTCYDEVYAEYNTKVIDFYKEFSKKVNDLAVDVQFAYFEDFSEMFKSTEDALIDAFPIYGTFVRLMKVLDPEDVKDLQNEYTIWMIDSAGNRSLLTLERFVNAVNVTIAKITSKLGNVTKELRNHFAPDSCKYLSCNDDLCNTPAAIDDVEQVTQPVEVTETTPLPSVSSKDEPLPGQDLDIENVKASATTSPSFDNNNKRILLDVGLDTENEKGKDKDETPTVTDKNEAATGNDETTTSGSKKLYASVLLNLMAMLVMYKST